MCGIVGSRNPEKIFPLLDDVSKRGTRAYSVSLIDLQGYKLGLRAEVSDEYKSSLMKKDFKKILESGGDQIKNPYWIVHLQSPTASNFSFHPARIDMDKYALWHNGMLESAELEKHKDANGIKPWDTQLLLQLLTAGDSLEASGIIYQVPNLQQFNGSFACLYLIRQQGLFAFRNRIAPMFYDSDGTVCSIMFKGAEKLLPNKVYCVPEMVAIRSFTNEYNPFGV